MFCVCCVVVLRLFVLFVFPQKRQAPTSTPRQISMRRYRLLFAVFVAVCVLCLVVFLFAFYCYELWCFVCVVLLLLFVHLCLYVVIYMIVVVCCVVCGCFVLLVLL